LSTPTPLSNIGEVELIERLHAIVNIQVSDPTIHSNLLKGISDDTAVYKPREGFVQLITTDAFVEGIHFDLTYTSPKHLGWKAMVANLSDIAAMGGTPRYAVISLALPNKISVEFIEQFYQGLALACREYSCLLVGGDTVGSLANMFISVTLVGEAKEDKIMYRNTAKVGDVICVTGHLGASHAGLKILQKEKARYAQATQPDTFKPNLEAYTPVLEKHLMPRPRLDIAQLLVEQSSVQATQGHAMQVHAMIDVSDGIASEIHRICDASDTGASIQERNIPLHENTKTVASDLHESAVDYALFGGEDYELLFTLTEEDFHHLQTLTTDISLIGRITSRNKGIELVKPDGEAVLLPFGGWDHFRK